jgi:chromosome partitioning protein
MRIHPIINQKGGVGKTTTAINLAGALSLNKNRVLIIDFDPQGNVSKTLFNVEDLENGKTMYDLLEQEITGKNNLAVKDVIRRYINQNVEFDVLPSIITLAAAERKLYHAPVSPEKYLRRILARMEKEGLVYDSILIDCQPSLGQLVINVLCCSEINELIIPIQPDAFSMQGLDGLFETLTEIKNGSGNSPKDYKFLITVYDDRRVEDRAQRKVIEEKFSDKVFKTIIRQCTALKTSHSYGDTIFNQEPRSNGAIDYMNLAKEILEGK